MGDTKENSALILAHEEDFAAALARHVIDKPKLSIWMILIPIFFVFYFFQLNKYRDGLRKIEPRELSTLPVEFAVGGITKAESKALFD